MTGTESKAAGTRFSPGLLDGLSTVSIRTLKTLSECPGVSGYETPVRDLLKRLVEPYADEITTDAIGNLIAVIDTRRKGSENGKRCDQGGGFWEGEIHQSAGTCGNGEGPRGRKVDFEHPASGRPVRVLLAAHMDEVGILITHIEKDGTLRFGCVGGIDASVLPAKRVSIGKSGVPGVILWKPIHLEKESARRRPPSVENLFIDIGATDADDARRMVAPGDFGVFATSFDGFGDGRVKGKAFDDRVGCLILAELIKRRSIWGGGDKIGSGGAMTVAFAFTVQEEVGLRGAACAAYAFDPDVALVIEGTICQDTPGAKPHEVVTRSGNGPVLTFMDRTSVADGRILEELRRIADRKGIKVQYKESTAGGNDAGRIYVTRAGVPTATVSVPCRYIHSPVSVASISDMEGALLLVEGFLESVAGGFRP